MKMKTRRGKQDRKNFKPSGNNLYTMNIDIALGQKDWVPFGKSAIPYVSVFCFSSHREGVGSQRKIQAESTV